MVDFIHDHVPSPHRLPVASSVGGSCPANNLKARQRSSSHHLLAQNLEEHLVKTINGSLLSSLFGVLRSLLDSISLTALWQQSVDRVNTAGPNPVESLQSSLHLS